jgi:CDP-diglyceride synthetase
MGGVAMRKTAENGIPDTAPYKEWLGIVGTMAVAVLICAVLFASSIPT